MTEDVVVLGATGTAGRLIAAELAARGLRLVLAGRDEERLTELAATIGGARTATVDLADPVSVRALSGAGRVLVNTVGPFATLAPAVVSACLDTGTGYVDIGNELSSVRAVLDRDEDARGRGVTLVTGAGFGLAATETLILTLIEGTGAPIVSALVAAAGDSAYDTPGVRATVAATMPEGATRYVDGELVTGPIGSGATTLTFGGLDWQAFPAPLGDLIAAQRNTGAGNVVAYHATRAVPAPDEGRTSFAYAEIVNVDGRRLAAELRTGEGFAVTAAVAAETAARLIAGDVSPGAWTPGRLLGRDLVTRLPGTELSRS